MAHIPIGKRKIESKQSLFHNQAIAFVENGFFTSSGTDVKDAVQTGINGREVQLVIEHESIEVMSDFELVVLFIVVGAPDLIVSANSLPAAVNCCSWKFRAHQYCPSLYAW